MNRFLKSFYFTTCLFFAAFFALPSYAQSDDFGMWLGFDLEKKINKKWSFDLDAEYRRRDHFENTDRWSAGIGANYRFSKWLKADAGYEFMYKFNPAEVENYLSESGKNNITKETERFWNTRHRVYASITGSYSYDRWKFSLRERWQYTYRPSTTVNQTKTKIRVKDGDVEDFDEEEEIEGKAIHQLRSRLQVSYDFRNSGFSPFVSCEMYSSNGIDKMRYSIGTEYNINKRNSLKLFYLYQDKNDDDEPNGHAIGLNYSFEF